MLKRLALAMLFAASALPAQEAQTYAATRAASPDAALLLRGLLDGGALARSESTTEWWAGGFTSGFLGPLGVGVVWMFARGSDVSLPMERRLAIGQESATYQRAFAESYSETLKAKRKKSTLMGGVAGMATATAFGLIYLALSDYDLFEGGFRVF